jgi:plastocyanin
MKKLLLLLAVVALSAFGLAACGGDDDDDDGGETTAAATTTTDTGAATGGGGGAGGTVKITAAADGSLAYDQSEVSAPAGPVTIDFDNPASLSHDVAVEDSSGSELGKTDLISESQTSTTIDLQAGSYTFFCTVPGHR